MKIAEKMGKLAMAVMAGLIVACSGENGADGRNAEEVNVDSLATAIRAEITGTLWDSLYAKPYVDTVYKILFDNAFGTAWMDSTRAALVDSLKQADYDSLYKVLYDSVYYDIYSQSVIGDLDGWTWTIKSDINLAFANQYPLLYKDYEYEGEPSPVPISVKARNECSTGSSFSNSTPCSYKKVLVKAWVPEWSDTGSVTKIVNPNTTELFAPVLRFDMEKAQKITAPQQVNMQIRAYALENDHEILFYSDSKPVTLYPVQVNGSERQGAKNRNWWYGVWVTPGMDSLQNILNDLKEKLPDGEVKAYYKYSDDATIAESSSRVVKAVYEVLQARQIKYVISHGSGTPWQKINYPMETLRLRQGLCIETTVLFASILEALGMQVFIVNIPSHAFVGWRTEKNGNVVDFVETTLLGGTSSYASANNSAIEEYNKQVAAGNFDTGDAELIDMAQVRKYGIVLTLAI